MFCFVLSATTACVPLALDSRWQDHDDDDDDDGDYDEACDHNLGVGGDDAP